MHLNTAFGYKCQHLQWYVIIIVVFIMARDFANFSPFPSPTVYLLKAKNFSIRLILELQKSLVNHDDLAVILHEALI